jgi:hypothetical protein
VLVSPASLGSHFNSVGNVSVSGASIMLVSVVPWVSQ